MAKRRRSGEDDQGPRWERVAIIIAAVSALASVVATVTLVVPLKSEVQGLESTIDLQEAQTRSLKHEDQLTAPHLTVRWLSTNGIFLSVPPSESVTDLFPDAKVVAIPPTDIYSVEQIQVEEGAISKSGCACADQVDPAAAQSPDWAFLVLTNDGGSTAQDLTLSGPPIVPGDKAYDMPEMLDVQVSQRPDQQFALGSIPAGESVIVAVYVSATALDENGEYSGIVALAPGLAPQFAKIIDPRTGEPSKVKIREPSQDTYSLSSAVAGRG